MGTLFTPINRRRVVETVIWMIDGYKNTSRADEDTPSAKTLAQVFREAGYTSLAHGKIFHNSKDTANRSWNRPVTSPGMSHWSHLDPASAPANSKKDRKLFYECVDVADNAYGDGVVAENTIADLKKLKQSVEPFFLACGFIRPHLPFYTPKKYWDLYDGAAIPLASNRYRPKNAPNGLRGSREIMSYEMGDFKPGTETFHCKMRHGYFAATSYADKLTGDVLNELESLGLADNTIVVIWGDHGWHLGEHDFWGKHNTLLDTPEAMINDQVYTRFKKADAIVTEHLTYSRYKNGEEMLYDLTKDPEGYLKGVGSLFLIGLSVECLSCLPQVNVHLQS